ncbi:MAG: DNA polymerase III subunit delta [Alphaproteobacteria bacterium]
MKFTVAQLQSFVRKPDRALRAMLIFGSDEGLVRERADAVAKAIVDDPSDPFRNASLGAADLQDDPARLADEAAAMSMTGGQRLIRVSNVGDRLGKLFDRFLADPPGDGFILVTAGDLAAKGSLRKAFEGAKCAAAIACTSDSGETLDSLIDQITSAAGLSVNDDARLYLRNNLGGDRMVSRTELEKLALYKLGDETPVSLEDARACVGDSSAEVFDAAGRAAASGDLAGLMRALDKARDAGESPIGMIRLTVRRLQRLHLVASMIDRGGAPDSAFKALKPPAWRAEQAEMRRLLSRWSPGRLAAALEILLEAETLCKTTGMPDQAIAARAMMRLAGAARAGMGR